MLIILIMLIIPIVLVHSPIYIPQVHGNMCVGVCVLSSIIVVIVGADLEQACVYTHIEVTRNRLLMQTLNSREGGAIIRREQTPC